MRGLAEFAHTNPKEVLPPKRHVLFMRPNTAPYERIGRYFIACQAEMNMILLGDVCCDLHDNLSKLSMAFSALPNGLHRRMLGEFADYVVSNFLVWIRGKSRCSLASTFLLKEFVPFFLAYTQAFSFRKLANKANWSVDMFFEVRLAKLRSIDSPLKQEQDNVVTDRFEESLRDARQCMQKVCGYAESLGRDEDSVECGVLSRDAVSRNLFEMLLPKMRRLQAQGGTGGGVCDAWMSTLGVLLTSKEREAYGIASASRD